MRTRLLATALAVVSAAACATADSPSPSAGEATTPGDTAPDVGTPTASPEDEAAPPPTPSPTGPDASATVEPDVTATAAPAWLGERVLPEREDGFGEILPTPPELDPRRIDTPDHLPAPDTEGFDASVGPVPDEVLERSTWDPACPVSRDDLAYVTVTFWGFDGDLHTGELLVARSVADDVTAVFQAAHDARFPIEEMRVVRAEELDLPPTGDGNNTTAFVCRPSRGTTSWSQHAYGTAVDINPFHNPYVKGDVVLPERASTYTDRDDVRDGMLIEGDPVVAAFDAAGWGWGGRWTSLTDPMHFSLDGT